MITKKVKKKRMKTTMSEFVTKIKEKYPEGTLIELIKMYDPQPVPEGTRGMVDYVDDIGTIHMKWENGRSLGLVPGTDEFRVLASPKKD